MTAPVPHLHAVVLAGGSGSRFWPLSRELAPKQMLTVFGGTSLVTQAVRRVERFVDAPVIVLTSEQLRGELADHLAGRPELGALKLDFVAEPAARNTAAAIALAAAVVEHRDPHGVLAVVASDHLLEDGDAWAVTLATALAAAEHGHIVTLGLVPDRPETGYGYIAPGTALDDVDGAFEVTSFAEKPDAATAARYLAEGRLWNSGMLVARAADILRELELAGDAAATPDSAHGRVIADAARALAAVPADAWADSPEAAAYAALPAVQFDRAVLEVSGRVAVVPTRLDWSDVGSLLALDALGPADARGNVLLGRAFDVGSHGVTAYSADRLVATLGLDDVVVVDTADATLVAAKDRVQDVREIVDALRASGAPEVTTSRTSLRPWGSWTLLLKAPGFQVKTIDVAPGKRLSLQSHAHRSEHWVVAEGLARVTRDGETLEIGPGQSVDLPQGVRHRLENAGAGVLRVIEVALGGYLGEDDIERFDDDWQRASR